MNTVPPEAESTAEQADAQADTKKLLNRSRRARGQFTAVIAAVERIFLALA